VIYGILTAALFGIGAPLSKLLLADVHPLAVAAFLYIGSGIGLACYLAAEAFAGAKRRDAEAALQTRDVPWLAGVILCGGFAAPLLLMVSLKATPGATAALLLNFEAVATTLIAAFLFREAVGARVWVALAFITSSCALLSWDPASILGLSLAAVGILVTCVSWAFDNNFSRQISGKDPVFIVALKGLCGGGLTMAAALFIGAPLPGPTVAAATMVLGFVSYGGLTSICFILALRGIGTARAGALLAISPLFGGSISLLLFHEVPDLRFLVAALIMAAGVVLLVSERHAHPHRHASEVHEHRHRHDDPHHEHQHSPEMPPLDASGEHSHLHVHAELEHEHFHRPDLHHRHRHE